MQGNTEVQTDCNLDMSWQVKISS